MNPHGAEGAAPKKINISGAEGAAPKNREKCTKCFTFGEDPIIELKQIIKLFHLSGCFTFQILWIIVELELFKADFTADEVFCCTGTTSKKTPNKELYKNIDFGIPTKAAQLAKENNIATFLVISAMGANAKSAIFYNKTKGQMELEVLSKNIANTYILRPSIIGGNRKESRIFEKIGILDFLINTR